MTCQDDAGLPPVARERALRPRRYGPLQQWDGHARLTGPCGDTMEFWVGLEAGRIARASFITDGCGSSRACGDMTATLSEGRLIDDASTLGQVEILDALGGLPAEMEHCALLASLTLRAACRDCLQGQTAADGQDRAERCAQAQEDHS